MLIEYFASEQEDERLYQLIERFNIKITEAFNPQDRYYVLETHDDRIVSLMLLCGIEAYISTTGEKIVGATARL